MKPCSIQGPVDLLLIPVEIEVPVLDVAVPAPEAIVKTTRVLSSLRSISIIHGQVPQVIEVIIAVIDK
jgi:hypothetical protein